MEPVKKGWELVTQSHINAGGDVVAGPKIVNEINIGVQTPSSHISRLLERLREEQKLDTRTADKMAELLRYGQPKEEPLIPLETKLKDGQREDLIEFAIEMKERFVKQLAKNTHFYSAQQIHYHFLSRICSVFQTRILPMIRQGVPRIAIERLIQTDIIDPTLADLGENPFLYSDEDVQGMIYYLTGTCHIRWN